MNSDAVWTLAESLPRSHIAHLYSEETIFTEALGMFVGYGLHRGEAVILMMTRPHREALERRLETGFDLEALQSDGQLILLDAEELLPKFMVDGAPDATLFKTIVGTIIDRARPQGHHRRVRVLAEMVNLLWKHNLPAAVRLEEIWNELIEAHEISLLCAYSVSASDAPHHFPPALRTFHSQVIPAAIVDSSEDAIVGWTLDARVASWNRGAERIYGYTAAEVIGQPTSILLPPGRTDDVLATVERIRRGEKVEHYETKRRRKNGTVIDVSVTVSPILSRDGELMGASVVARDITERKQAEEARLQLAAIVESSDDAIIGKTLDATIVSWNRGAEQIYGYAAAEAIGQPISILLPPDREDDLPRIMERIRHGQKVEHYETKRRRKDGTVIDVSVTVSPIISRDGELMGASAVARDITERKQAAEARRQQAELREAQATQRLLLERVIAGQEEERRRIARELHDEAGQLLTSLLVGLRALEDAGNLAEAKAQGLRLREITAQAIDEVGRLARGLRPAVLDDHGLGVALSRYVAEYTKTHNVAVDLRFGEPGPSNMPPAVQIGLYRILQEALTNVARHSGAKAVSVTFARSAAAWEIAVTDDGCGFDINVADFVSSSHLGIHGMRERAAILGGTVRFRAEGTGTTVLVRIPFTHEDSQPSLGPRNI